ncbi:MAG: heparan-alpha-glucosaminide N-acetyltransferase domain-containing protein [Bacteroidales bacterium]
MNQTVKVTQGSQRIASIDWMRGLVMVVMLIDHVSMAFDGAHSNVAMDSARFPDANHIWLPAFAFFTRWIAHICAPTFVLLAGTALALSAEKRAAKGMNAWEIDKGMLIRGAIIALIDPTIISLGSGHWNIGVLTAIGLSMMAMAGLRRLNTTLLLVLSIGWMFFGELITGLVWSPPGSSTPLAALFVANYAGPNLLIHYPVIPWLALMILGWVLGRHIVQYNAGQTKVSPTRIFVVAGIISILVFLVVRYFNGYGNMFLYRSDNLLRQWLHVSKYPPSLTYYGLELGLLAFSLALLIKIEAKIGVRPNGPILVFGQTAMFYYLLHRLVLEIPATYFGLRGFGDISTTYIVWAAMLVPLYYACIWYRDLKKAHPDSVLKYF